MQIDQDDDSVIDSTLSELILLFVFTCIVIGSGLAAQMGPSTEARTMEVFPGSSNMIFKTGEFELTPEMQNVLLREVVPSLRKAHEAQIAGEFHLIAIGYTDEQAVNSGNTIKKDDEIKTCTRQEQVFLAMHHPSNGIDPAICEILQNEFKTNLNLGMLRAEAVKLFVFEHSRAWSISPSISTGGQLPGSMLSSPDTPALPQDDGKFGQDLSPDRNNGSDTPVVVPNDKALVYAASENPPMRRVELFLVRAPLGS